MAEEIEVTYQDLKDGVDCLADRIEAEWGRPSNVVGIAKGGWFPALLLANRFDVRKAYSVGAKRYEGGEGGELEVYQLPLELPEGKTLLVDEVVQKGITMERIGQLFEGDVCTATLYLKKESEFEPDFYWKKTGNEWLVFPWEKRS